MRATVNIYVSFFKSITHNIKLYLLILFLATIVSSAYNVLFGIYLINLGFNEAFVGKLLSLNTLGIAMGAIPVAIFAERLNRKTTLIIGLSLMAISNLVVLNVTIPTVMVVFAFLFGFGNSTLMVLQAPIIYDNTPKEQRVTAFSMTFVIQNIAFVIGSILLGHLSQFLTTVTSAATANKIVLNASTTLIFFGIYFALKFDGKQMTLKRRDDTVLNALQNVIGGFKKLASGKTLLYLIQVALVGVGAGMIVPFFSMYLKFSLAVDDGVVGTIMAISQIGTVAGGLLVPVLVTRFGSVKTILACQLLSIPFLISISFPQGIFLMTLSFFFRSSLMNMAGPIVGNLSMEIVEEETRTYMSSLVSLTSNLFRATGIFIGGFLMFKFDYNTPYYFTILCYLIGTFIVYKVFINIDKK